MEKVDKQQGQERRVQRTLVKAADLSNPANLQAKRIGEAV